MNTGLARSIGVVCDCQVYAVHYKDGSQVRTLSRHRAMRLADEAIASGELAHYDIPGY